MNIQLTIRFPPQDRGEEATCQTSTFPNQHCSPKDPYRV